MLVLSIFLLTLANEALGYMDFPNQTTYRNLREGWQILRGYDKDGNFHISLNKTKLEALIGSKFAEKNYTNQLGYFEPKATKEATLTAMGKCPNLIRMTLYKEKARANYIINYFDVPLPNPTAWEDQGSFYCAENPGYCGATQALMAVKTLDGRVEYSVDDQEIAVWQKSGKKYDPNVSPSRICYVWNSFTLRMDLLTKDNQLTRLYNLQSQFMRLAMNQSAIQAFSAKEGVTIAPLGRYINESEGVAALKWCPKLVKRSLFYSKDKPFISDIADKKDAKWDLVGTFYCAPEYGYCEARRALKLVVSKKAGDNNFWATDNKEIESSIALPFYDNKVNRTACWIWN